LLAVTDITALLKEQENNAMAMPSLLKNASQINDAGSGLANEVSNRYNSPSTSWNPQSGSATKDAKQRKDPFLSNQFWVSIEGIAVASFSECSAITVETEVHEHIEGGENTYTYKLPVRTKFGNITLKRGLDETGNLFSWYLDCVDPYNIIRRTITIALYDYNGKINQSWDLKEAFPVKWTGPDMRSETGALAVESVEFAYHGLLPRGSSGNVESMALDGPQQRA
jgi:phage tail-like protein